MKELNNNDIRKYYGICKLDDSYSDTISITNMALK